MSGSGWRHSPTGIANRRRPSRLRRASAIVRKRLSCPSNGFICFPVDEPTILGFVEAGAAITNVEWETRDRFLSLRRALGIRSFDLNQLTLQPASIPEASIE